MKTKLIIFTIAIFSLLSLNSYSNEFAGLMPWDRKTVTVQSNEKSPFTEPESKPIMLVFEQQIAKAKKIAEVYNRLGQEEENDIDKKIAYFIQAAYWHGVAKGIEESVYIKLTE
jgi:hypothetical protein